MNKDIADFLGEFTTQDHVLKRPILYKDLGLLLKELCWHPQGAVVRHCNEFFGETHQNAPTVAYLLLESLKNAAAHGNQGYDPVATLYLGSPDIVFAFYDGGDYFTCPEVKDAWEQNPCVPSSGVILDSEGEQMTGCGAGSTILIEATDILRVDDGRIYWGWSFTAADGRRKL